MKRIISIFIIGLIIISFTGCKDEKKNTSASSVKKTESNENVEAFGVVKIKEIRNIHIDFLSKVSNVSISENQRVKNGDILLSLDISDFKTQINNKKCERDILDKEIESLKRDLNVKESNYTKYDCDPQLKKYSNDLTNAQNIYNKYLNDLAAQESLYNSGAIPKSDYDNLKIEVDSKKKDIEDIKYAINTLLYNKDKDLKTKLDKYQILKNEIEVMTNKINKTYLSNNNVICDMKDGVIYDISYKSGDCIDLEKKALSIMNMDTMYIEASVPEELIKDVKIGAKVIFCPVADKSKKYNGKIVKLAQKAVVNNGETNIPVEIAMDNKDDFLKPDFNVEASISIGK